MFIVTLVVYALGFTVVYRDIGNPFLAVSYLLVVIPVGWFWGWKAAIWCSLAGVIVNTAAMLLLGELEYFVSLILQGAVFYTLVGVIIGWMSDTIRKLRQAHAEIRSLQKLLPICAECKKIRDDEGYWHQVESYISDRTNTTFSHGICPECASKYFEDHSEAVPSEKVTEKQKT